jgi:hypothetical protein
MNPTFELRLRSAKVIQKEHSQKFGASQTHQASLAWNDYSDSKSLEYMKKTIIVAPNI